MTALTQTATPGFLAATPASASVSASARPLALTAALGLALCIAAACTPPPAPLVCNGSEALCARHFDEVVFAGAHNAMSSIHDDFAAPNQREDIADQLQLGVRAFLIDTYVDDDGTPLLCHANCAVGHIDTVETLTVIRHHLEENPGDVIALLVQDESPVASFEQAMTDADLVDRALVHDPAAPWPTMAELAGKVFVTAEHSGPPPPWNHAMFEHYVDTPFSFATIDDLAAAASCDENRGSDENALMLVNHWAENPFPDETVAADVNAHDFLKERALRCAGARGHVPNVIAVDWVGTGDLFAVVDELNQVAASTTAE